MLCRDLWRAQPQRWRVSLAYPHFSIRTKRDTRTHSFQHETAWIHFADSGAQANIGVCSRYRQL